MAESLYLQDMYLKEFGARVVSVTDGKYVVLDRTAFYPKSGGVACDRGVLVRGPATFDVVFAGKFGGQISHEVQPEGLRPGDEVSGRLDWERRHLLMRYHTAAHVISGVFYKHSTAKITGNELDVDGGRIDFSLQDFDRQLIEGYVEKANQLIAQDLPVVAYTIAREELDRRPDMVKLAAGLPEGLREVRVVDIKGFDAQPDGGCHVASLGEVGRIVLQKLVNKGKDNRRLYFTLI